VLWFLLREQPNAPGGNLVSKPKYAVQGCDKAPTGQPTYITELELAERLGVDVRCLRNWRLRGNGPPFYKLGRLVRYDLSESIEWVKLRRAVSTTEADQRRSG
jgi:hypothetical protein